MANAYIGDWSILNSFSSRTVWIAVIGILIFKQFFKMFKGHKTLHLPPSPPKLPVIGNLHMLGGLPHQSFEKLAKIYGDIMFLKMGQFSALVVSTPDLAKEILQTRDHQFATRKNIIAGDILAYGGKSTSLANGETWRFLRKTISMEVVSAKRLAQAQSIRREELVYSVESILAEGSNGEIVDIDQKVTELIFNQTTQFIFRKRFYGARRKDVTTGADIYLSLMHELLSVTNFFMIGELFPALSFLDFRGKARCRKLASNLDVFYNAILADHRDADGRHIHKSHSEQDFVDVFLTKQEEGQFPVSDDLIKAGIQDVIIASSSTSSSSVSWALSELLRHPHVLQRAQKEIDDVVGKERLVEEDDLTALPYLKAVVKEVFRMHPAVPLLIPHYTDVATTTAGYDIPAKTTVFVNVHAIGRDPRVWEKPLDFNPDRFLGSPIDSKGQHFQLLPFGAGRRMCPGFNLGLITVEYTLAQLLHTCDISLPDSMSPQELGMEEKPGAAAMSRLDPLRVVIRPRLPSHVYVKEGMTI